MVSAFVFPLWNSVDKNSNIFKSKWGYKSSSVSKIPLYVILGVEKYATIFF